MAKPDKERPVLGLLPPLDSGLCTLQQAGQHSRFIEQYLRSYVHAFRQVYYFSYFHERLADYTADDALLQKVTLLPGSGRRLYTFQMPFLWAKAMRQCSVLRVYQVTGAIPAAIARLLWGIPFVVTYGYHYAQVARSEGYRWRSFLLSVLEWIGLHTANAIIVTTPALAKYVGYRVPIERIHLIPNSVDTDRFVPAERTSQGRRVVFVGRLEPQKNVPMLVEALSQIQPTPELLLVGDGSERQRILLAARRKGVPVEATGVVPHEKLPRLLQSADVFALPSLIEGHPKALLEAMSCGLPCVGLDVPGTRDVIHHGRTGLLASADAVSLAKMLRQVLENRPFAQALGRQARLWVEKQYSAQGVMQQELALLLQIAEEQDAR
mgnify:CR=1 FL=1